MWLAKCSESLPIRWSRPLPEGCEPSTITVKLDARGRWFVSLLVDNPTIKSLPACNKSVGLDMGISSKLATSDGEKVVNPRHFNRKYKRLRQSQKTLSRRQKGSSNREKARHQVARIQASIKDARLDFLHKLTTRLVRENQTIAVEDLAVANMVKNPLLARSISDVAWGELVRQLTYKCAGSPGEASPGDSARQWYGRTLVKIDRWFPSSKRCGHCGHVIDKLPLSVREWTCPSCKTVHDRDINAARNILAAGLAVLAGNSEEVCRANIRPDRHSSKGQLRKTRERKKQKT